MVAKNVDKTNSVTLSFEKLFLSFDNILLKFINTTSVK